MKKIEIALFAIFTISVIISSILLVICIFSGDNLVALLKPYIISTSISSAVSALIFIVSYIKRNEALIGNGQ